VAPAPGSAARPVLPCPFAPAPSRGVLGTNGMARDRIGKYRIDGEIGRGTMGEVYKAYDPVLKRHVALKTLTVHTGPADEAHERFQREAQAAALLNHPNIVTVHDFGEEDGLRYIAMELLEGTDLRDAIDSDLLKTLDDKLAVMDSVLAALDYAHGKGVVHRDIKPANIHLGPQRQVKIMDFGLARISTSEMTQEGIVLGTPNYMSPEQALGDKVDGRSDVFSTGAVLYELLTGHKPFEADSTPSVLFQVVHKQPPPVRRWAPDVPSPLVTVVNRALEKDRERRYLAAGDMRAALALARQATAAPSFPSPPPLPPRASSPSVPASAVPPAPAAWVGDFDFSSPDLPVPPRPRQPTPQPSPSPASLRTPPPRAGSGGGLPRVSLALGAVLATVVVAIVAGTVWLRGRSAATTSPAASSPADVGALTRALVSTTVQLAQRELNDKNYGAAIKQAQSALQLEAAQKDATRILNEARAHLQEIDSSIAEARRQLEAGDTEAASRELSHLLELDPRHPAATELSARLNTVFRAQAEEAAASVRAARSAAVGAGVKADVLRQADTDSREADGLVEHGEFADATRRYLETRDTLDRERRAALERAPAVSSAPTAAPDAVRPAPTPSATPRLAAASAAVLAPTVAPPAPKPVLPEPTALPVPARSFVAEATTIATPSAGSLEGFDTADVKTRRPPEFTGRLEFEVVPPAVRPGDPFVVRIHIRNDGRKSVRVRGLSVAIVADGQRAPASVKTLQREAGAQRRTLVAEYSGIWSGARSWTLEAVVTADRDETITSHLRVNQE
jgi:serine/threonine protein kinase